MKRTVLGFTLGLAVALAISVGAQEQPQDDWTAPDTTPASIGDVVVTLYDVDGTPTAARVEGRAVLLNAAGETVSTEEVEDLKPLLTAQEQADLWAMMQRIRAVAEERLLPGGEQ